MPRGENFPALPDFQDDKSYHVQLYKKAEYAGRIFTAAMKDIRVRGDVAKKIQESIYKADEIKEGTA